MQVRLEQYRSQVSQYLANAYLHLQRGEGQKASELLWGSMAEALKGVAARKGLLLRTHREIRSYARRLAGELQDRSIWDSYVKAEHLHADFYEVFLDVEDVGGMAEDIREAVGKLIALMEEPL